MRIRKIVNMAAATVFGLAAVVVYADDAQAYSRTYVENHASSSYWPINYTQNWVDQYTGSDLTYGTCPSTYTGYKCIRVYERYYSKSYSGWTCLPNQWCKITNDTRSYTRIYLNQYRRSYSWYARRNIATHELFHGITGNGYHSAYCTNVMYGSVFCSNGSLPAYRFTDYAKSVLRTH